MKRLLFVHIAKTGGMSLRRLLRTTPAANSYDCLHHNYLLRFREGRQVERLPVDPSALTGYDVAVLTVRHPLQRLRSCYRYFLAGGLNGRGKGHFPADLEVQHFLEIALQLLTSVVVFFLRFLHVFLFQPASHWLRHCQIRWLTLSLPFASQFSVM